MNRFIYGVHILNGYDPLTASCSYHTCMSLLGTPAQAYLLHADCEMTSTLKFRL